MSIAIYNLTTVGAKKVNMHEDDARMKRKRNETPERIHDTARNQNGNKTETRKQKENRRTPAHPRSFFSFPVSHESF